MISDFDCNNKIKAYAVIYNLEYSILTDPGHLLERHQTPHMDIDLRSSFPDDELLLQFYGLYRYEFSYVFKWTRDENTFTQIMCDINLNDSESVIDVLMCTITNRDHITLRYGLK